jgi:hypothetical protein
METNNKLMKAIHCVAGLSLVAFATACNPSEDRYLDLSSNQYVNLEKDTASGLLVNTETRKPVTLYVDTHSHDTIQGTTGKVVNGHLIRHDDGKWIVKGEGDEFKAESGDAKVKVEDGDTKVKDGAYTKKVSKDGDVKIETGTKTIKIDGKTGKRKVKKDKNIGDKLKKIIH